MYTSAIVLIAHPTVPTANVAKKHTKSFPASVRGAAPP